MLFFHGRSVLFHSEDLNAGSVLGPLCHKVGPVQANLGMLDDIDSWDQMPGGGLSRMVFSR